LKTISFEQAIKSYQDGGQINLNQCSFITLIQLKCFGEQQAVVQGATIGFFSDVCKKIDDIRTSPDISKLPTIRIFYEKGYRWSVYVEGEDESRNTNLNKAEALVLGRLIRRNEFNGQAKIDSQTLSKMEIKENIRELHQTTETYFNRYQYNN